MAEDKELLGVVKSNINEFYNMVRAKSLLITGLKPMSRKMQMLDEDMRFEMLYKPVLALGDPGIGKTAGVLSIVKEMKEMLKKAGRTERFGFKKIQLGQTQVGELNGIPMAKQTPLMNPDGTQVLDKNGNPVMDVLRAIMPDLPIKERDGEFGILFLDELTSADVAQSQPAMGLCDSSRSAGVYHLPDGWLVIAAGNGPGCRNYVELTEAVLSRFVVFDIEFSYRDGWSKWARDHEIDPLILTFLDNNPEWCNHPTTDTNDEFARLSPNPRTWTALSGGIMERDNMAELGLEKPLSAAEMRKFASHYVGKEAAELFAAYALLRENLMNDSDTSHLATDILEGKALKQIQKLKEKAVKTGGESAANRAAIDYLVQKATNGKTGGGTNEAQVFSLVMNMVIQELRFQINEFLDNNGVGRDAECVTIEDLTTAGKDGAPLKTDKGNIAEDLTLVKAAANMYNYMFEFKSINLDMIFGNIMTVSSEVKHVPILISSDEFNLACPQFEQVMNEMSNLGMGDDAYGY